MRIWQHKGVSLSALPAARRCSQLIQEVCPVFAEKNVEQNNHPKHAGINIKLQERLNAPYSRFKCPGLNRSARSFPPRRRAHGCFCCCSSWSETEEQIFTRQILLCREKWHVPERRKTIGSNTLHLPRLSAWRLATRTCQSLRHLTTKLPVSDLNHPPFCRNID